MKTERRNVMDYEPATQMTLSTSRFPSGTYICTACNMMIDVTANNKALPICPCCEQQVIFTAMEEGYLHEKE